MSKQGPHRVAIIGTVGIPAIYGGFETLVEQLVTRRINQRIHYTVYCSSRHYKERPSEYKGANLRYIPLKANGIQSIPYDIISMIRAARRHDTMLILGVSGCIFLPILRLFYKKKRIVINIDGLEHQRAKWSKQVRRFLKFSEEMAVKYADEIISDNKGIEDYLKKEYGIQSEMVPYGGNQIQSDVSPENRDKILGDRGLTSKEYALAICRIEPENNVEMILEAFRMNGKEELLFIGNWGHSAYAMALKERYSGCPNIRLEDAVYDQDVVNTLRANCKYYIHGHSAGGTNPSLVEAMFFRVPILAYDVVYNRHTTCDSALYFNSAEGLNALLQNRDPGDMKNVADKMYEIADDRYHWEHIVTDYEDLYI